MFLGKKIMELSKISSMSNLHMVEGVGGGRHGLTGTSFIASNFYQYLGKVLNAICLLVKGSVKDSPSVSRL